MKQKDIVLLIFVGFISGIFSIVASKYFIAPPKNRQQKVEIVEAVSAEFPQPDKKYFNANSVDPTKLINIGDKTNPQPFNGTNTSTSE